MHTLFALPCFVVVIHWLIFPYPSGLLHWHCGNLTIAPVPAKQPWWIWINTSCEFIMNDCITTTKQSTTKPCAYFLGYTVYDYLSIPLWWCSLSWSLVVKGFPRSSFPAQKTIDTGPHCISPLRTHISPAGHLRDFLMDSTHKAHSAHFGNQIHPS